MKYEKDSVKLLYKFLTMIKSFLNFNNIYHKFDVYKNRDWILEIT